MKMLSDAPNKMHSYKYAVIEDKILAVEKLMDESMSLKAILKGYEKSRKKPLIKELRPLMAAFESYSIGMVDYPTVSQKIYLTLADADVMMARVIYLKMFHGWMGVNGDDLNLIDTHIENALGNLWECYTLVESKVIPKEKRQQ